MEQIILKNKEGIECMPLHIWVEQYGSDQDKLTHDDPNPENVEKRALINRYYQEVDAHTIEFYRDDILVANKLLTEHLSPVKDTSPSTIKNGYYYRNTKGKYVTPIFSLWVQEFGTEEDKAIHDDPLHNPTKQALLDRYLSENDAYECEVWEEGSIVRTFILYEEEEETSDFLELDQSTESSTEAGS